MKRLAMVVLLALVCAGCFGSDMSLYDAAAPLRPLQPGPVSHQDKDGKLVHLMLAQDANGVYRLTVSDPGDDFGKGYRMRFFALEGAPSGLLVAEVKDCNADFAQCDPGTGLMYELIRILPDRVEWRDPDCSKVFSQLSGVAVAIDTCKFTDRASLEKALLVAAAMPWQADDVYMLH